MSKRKELIRFYDNFKIKSFYGVGQRKTKLFMNSLLKSLDAQIKTTPKDDKLIYKRNALLFFRAILECENCNINAKKYFNTDSYSYQDYNYSKKYTLIQELLSIAQSIGVDYGYTQSNDPATKYIVYFELPQTGEQVSFHSNIDKERLNSVPNYNKGWDHKINSSLQKIENAFCAMFGEELKKKFKIAA